MESIGEMEVVFRKEGEFWTVELGATVIHLRDAKGLHYLARLLATPERPLAALDLADVGRMRSGPPDEAGPGSRGGPVSEAAHSLDLAERARSAVTKRIKDAIRRIHVCHPVLGRHLMRTVKTGHACVYHPDPDRPTRWVLS